MEKRVKTRRFTNDFIFQLLELMKFNCIQQTLNSIQASSSSRLLALAACELSVYLHLLFFFSHSLSFPSSIDSSSTQVHTFPSGRSQIHRWEASEWKSDDLSVLFCCCCFCIELVKGRLKKEGKDLFICLFSFLKRATTNDWQLCCVVNIHSLFLSLSSSSSCWRE